MQQLDYDDDSLFKSAQTPVKAIPSLATAKPCTAEADDLELCNRLYGANDFKCKGRIRLISEVQGETRSMPQRS